VDPEKEMKLPALRESAAVAEYVDTPASELVGFLAFLRGELNCAIDNLRYDTLEALESGDPSEKIQTINRLRLNKNRIQAHLLKELKEVKELGQAMKSSTDKAVLSALLKECRKVAQEIGDGLMALSQDFELD